MNAMDTPDTRSEFERRIYMLAERMRKGLISFAPGLKSPSSLLAIRSLPNGRIDLLSVDEIARLTANMTTQVTSESIRPMVQQKSEPGPPQEPVTNGGSIKP